MWVRPVELLRASPARALLAGLMVAIFYVLLGRLAFSVSVEHSNVTSVVFAPEGIALAFAIIFGRRVAWGVFAGQAILSIWSGPSVLGGCAIGIVNSLECVLGATLFARWRISPRFGAPRDLLLFAALVFLVLQPISATGGVAVLRAVASMPHEWLSAGWQSLQIHGIQIPVADSSTIPSAWVHWWIGNSVGQILIAPLLLAWSIKGTSRRPSANLDLLVSAVAIGLLGLVATVLPIHPLLILGLTYPLLVWIGLRRGLRGVTTANVLIAPAITWAGASGHGFLSHLSVPDRLAYVGFFIATASMFSLMLFAMFEERRVLVDRLHQLARQDSLLPMANRRYLVERLEYHLQDTPETTLAVVVFDVDHFKAINDENGHAVGDLVLTVIADTCLSLLDDDYLAARIGGEEFAILLPGIDLSGGRRFADRLRNAIAEQHLTHPRPELVPITVSAGVTVARSRDSLDSLLSRADNALYAAKRGGRNIVVSGD